jgi:hypothetical protein
MIRASSLIFLFSLGGCGLALTGSAALPDTGAGPQPKGDDAQASSRDAERPASDSAAPPSPADASARTDAPSDATGGGDADAMTPAQDAGSCTSSADCTNGKVCCATATLSGAFFPYCLVDSPRVTRCVAASTCTTRVPTECLGESTARLCGQPTDCSNNGAYSRCCKLETFNKSVTACISNGVTTGGGVAISCLP